MSKENFEGIISELLKGTANIESVNFHFGDCNSTTYMGGDVEEEYEAEYGSDDCGCCPGDFPVVDSDAVAEWVQKKTGIDRATIGKVLEAEEEYLEEIGVSIPFGACGDDESGKTGSAGEPDQGSEPEEDTESKIEAKSEDKALDEMLDKVLDDVMPGLLCMGLMGAIFDDIFNPGKGGRKEQKDGKKE